MADPRTKETLQEGMHKVEQTVGSPTVCTAKWLQTTTLLFNGTTHSCHHTPRHKIDPIKVRFDPKLLHNTPEKEDQRQKMLNGQRPPECGYCWAIEDVGAISDRVMKSTSSWGKIKAREDLTKFSGNPTYFEVAFDSTCNMKCMYCGPEISSKWMEEIKRDGPYPTSSKLNNIDRLKEQRTMPIPHHDPNPYIDAFWKWWPELYQTLQVFRITGGEPLLSKHTWKLLDILIDTPRKDLELGVNTNLSVNKTMVNAFIDRCKELEDKLKDVIVYTSCEATGKQAEYIRFGMNYDEFAQNCYDVLHNTKRTCLSFMTTIGSLSLFSLEDFTKFILELRKEFGARVRFDYGLLRGPDFMDIRLVDKRISLPHLRSLLNYLETNGIPIDVQRALRLIQYAQKEIKDRDRLLSDFRAFYIEYDKRRKTDFKATFPELAFMLESVS